MQAKEMMCCGLMELKGISHLDYTVNPNTKVHYTAEEIFKLFILRGQLPFTGVVKKAFFIFTSAHCFNKEKPATYGEKFAQFVVENELGEIVFRSSPIENPNSGNFITIYVWKINHKNLKLWCEAHFRVDLVSGEIAEIQPS